MEGFFLPAYYIPMVSASHLSSPISLSSTPPPPPTTTTDDLRRPSDSPPVPISPEMESVLAVEKIVNYSFRNKGLLKEALTHSSCKDSPSNERLEFLGDSAIGLAFSNYLYLVYSHLEPHMLSQLRSANVSTEKFARVSLNLGLFQFLRRNAPFLDEKVKEFSDAVGEEDDHVSHGGLVKAPKVLADLFEAVVGAIYVDLNFDLEKFWVVCRGFLEPIVTFEDLQRQPQPVSMLFQLCHKHDKQIDIKISKDEKGTIAEVYLADELFASGRAENKDTAKLIAAKEALQKLAVTMPSEMVIDDGSLDVEVELEEAKKKLHELCLKKKWPKPVYSVEEEGGSPHAKIFICSVKIPAEQGTFYMKGDEHSKKKKAENSAAYHMIRSLRASKYL